MEFQSTLFKNFVKGLIASADRYNQPQGSVSRGSNLLLSKRGSLTTCDGSQIIEAFNGNPVGGRGKAMCEFLFAPTGVARYFLRVMKALDHPLGDPQNFTLTDAGPGGTIPPNTSYRYGVTAIDGAGGETRAISNPVFVQGPASHKVTLTWNVVPNAVAYNIYRQGGPPFIGTPNILLAPNLPVSQAPFGTLTASYTDDGTALNTTQASVPLVTMMPNSQAAFTLYVFNTPSGQELNPAFFPVGMTFNYTAGNDPRFTGPWKVVAIAGENIISAVALFDVSAIPVGALDNSFFAGVATSSNSIGSPAVNTTQQTGLYACFQAAGGRNYNTGNLVALFPADPLVLDGGLPGGSGGGGGKGGGGTGQQGSTPSGGLPTGVTRGTPGNVSFIPEIVQFANQAALALGNAFPPQVYKDSTGTPTNPAVEVGIASITVDAFGVVTLTTLTPHGIDPTQGIGACIYIESLPAFATYGSSPNFAQCFVTIAIPSATQVKYFNPNAIGNGPAGAGGNLTVTTTPFINTFTNPYPTWASGVTYLVGDIITPPAANGHFYKAIQGGVSGAAAPAFSTVSNAQFPDGVGSPIIWQEDGLSSATAPPPPGAGHIRVFAGSLWVWNTAVSNTTDGLDGPTCLRMSDSNNLNSWNPINQAFIDKDDGTEGMGLQAFTIAGFGIPPEGSLVAFKTYAGYQVVGVFGSPNFLIQRIKSDLGCIAPRSIQFITGYGLARYSHLGFAVFDGINDKVISEEIRPYLFPSNNIEDSDLTIIDYNWAPVSWGSQTVNPPMYVCAMPIGNSGGALTRIFCYDLVLKAWTLPVDLPFRISTLYQARALTSIPITVMGTFNDGALHRWQAGDNLWDLSEAGVPQQVAWNVSTPMVFNQRAQGGRIYCRQIVTRGKFTDPLSTINVALEIEGLASSPADSALYTLGPDGTFHLITAVDQKFTNMDAIISGTGAVELQSFDPQIVPLSARTPPRLT